MHLYFSQNLVYLLWILLQSNNFFSCLSGLVFFWFSYNSSSILVNSLLKFSLILDYYIFICIALLYLEVSPWLYIIFLKKILSVDIVSPEFPISLIDYPSICFKKILVWQRLAKRFIMSFLFRLCLKNLLCDPKVEWF